MTAENKITTGSRVKNELGEIGTVVAVGKKFGSIHWDGTDEPVKSEVEWWADLEIVEEEK
jgi:hypothetical protein